MLKALSTALFIAAVGVTASMAQIVSGPNGIPIVPTTPPDIANPGLTQGPPGAHLPRTPASPAISPSPAPTASPMLNSTRPAVSRRYVVRDVKRARPVAKARSKAARTAKPKASRVARPSKTNNANSGVRIRDICRGC